jgi:hypothetical protein
MVMTGHLEDTLAEPERVTPALHPRLGTFPGSFFRLLPVVKNLKPPEYARVPVEFFRPQDFLSAAQVQAVFCCEWNIAWEAGPVREQLFERKLPEGLRWIHKFPERNFNLVPAESGYSEYAALYNLIPARFLRRHKLPAFNCGLWPALGAPAPGFGAGAQRALGTNWRQRFGAALAEYLWPLLCERPRSPIAAFSKNDSIRLLAHNIDFWLSHLDVVLQEAMRGGFPRIDSDEATLARCRALDAAAQKHGDSSWLTFAPPLCGGTIWEGEAEAWEFTQMMVEAADQGGRLRALIDAIESHRVEDDFTARWSPAKEDLERKLYGKRSKVQVTFVELDDTIPIHAPEVEVENDKFWQDFFAFLNPKQRRLVVLLRSGHTQQEIAKALGYRNHSPISKALAKIADRAKKMLGTAAAAHGLEGRNELPLVR